MTEAPMHSCTDRNVASQEWEEPVMLKANGATNIASQEKEVGLKSVEAGLIKTTEKNFHLITLVQTI